MSAKTKELVKAENLAQLEAFERLNKAHTDLMLIHLIEAFGAEFRATIEEIEAKEGRVPTADDLLWLAGIHLGQDPRDIADKCIKCEGK